MADDRHDAAFVVGAVLGGVAGAAYALLNAPQSGHQTRAQLAAQIDSVFKQAGAATAQIDGRARGLVDRAAESIATRLEPPAQETPAAAPVEPAATGVAAAGAEPVSTLPDPLEPPPVASPEGPGSGVDESGTAGSPGDLDVVIDGPRPASSDR